MKRLLAIGLSLGALAGSVPASAQDLTDLIGLDYSSSNEDIVVTHTPDPEPDQGEVHGQIREIAQSGNIFNEPLALFQAKLCPGPAERPRDSGSQGAVGAGDDDDGVSGQHALAPASG